MADVMGAAVCSGKAVNYNPTLSNPIDGTHDQRNAFCVNLLILLREHSGQEVKDTTTALAAFPGAVAETAAAELTSRSLTVKASRRRWLSTGMYAMPGKPVSIRVSVVAAAAAHDGSQPPAIAPKTIKVQVGSHNWVDGAADHGVGWNVEWKRFPKLTTSVYVASAAPPVNITCWFGGLVYIDIDDALLGKMLQIDVGNALLAPSFTQGVTTAAQWSHLQQHAQSAVYGEIETAELVFVVKASKFRRLSFSQMTQVNCIAIPVMHEFPIEYVVCARRWRRFGRRRNAKSWHSSEAGRVRTGRRLASCSIS